MSPEQVPEFVVEVNEEPTSLWDRAAVCEMLERLASRPEVEIWLLLDHGPVPWTWLRRLLLLHTRRFEMGFHLQRTDDVATLTFFDANHSEYCASDPAYPVEATHAQRMALSGGEPTPLEPEFCLGADRAFRAAIESVRDGTRPTWLTYRFFR